MMLLLLLLLALLGNPLATFAVLLVFPFLLPPNSRLGSATVIVVTIVLRMEKIVSRPRGYCLSSRSVGIVLIVVIVPR